MKTILKHLFEHKKLSYDEAYKVLTRIALNDFSESEIASFLTIYNVRNVTIDELSGFRDALLDLCIKTDLSDFDTIDLCGTGGDGKDTFNISTLASLVVAGAGYKVAKHGNYGVSSGCGSSNVLESLGYKFTNDVKVLKRQIEKAGICVLHAPLFHPAMKSVAPVRKQLGLKTFFNMLGPMVNPSRPKYQLTGVYNLELLRLYNYMYQQTDVNYAIIHSIDGYDEVSLTGNFRIASSNSEQLLSPEYFGFETITASEIGGGSTVTESVEIFKKVLNGQGTLAQNNVVIANAALAIKQFNNSKSIEDCIDEAKTSLLGGKALKSLKDLLNN